MREKSGDMNLGTATPTIHIPLHVQPVQSEERRCNEYKSNNNSEAIQIGDLSFRV